MRTEAKKPVAVRVARWSIIGAVVAGAALIAGVVDLSEGGGLMSRIFFLFLGAVIAVQVIPCVMLLGAMLKGVAGLVSKKAKVTARHESK